MSWEPEVDGIRRRRALALEMGGEEAVARQHALGRKTVRERLALLVDPGSLREEGPIAGVAERDQQGELVAFQPANYVLGIARLDGRNVVVGGEDFTQRGGSPNPAGLRKSVYAEELALRYRLPLVRFLEGGGGSVTGSGGKGVTRPLPAAVNHPARFLSIAEALRTVPVVSAAVGPVAGFPAARLAASHFAVMVRDTSQVMIAGPAVVERALGERKDKEALGGWRVHSRSGLADRVAWDEDDACALMRRFLSYLPPNVDSLPPSLPPRADDGPARRDPELLSIIPRDRRFLYDMRDLVGCCLDRDSFFELSPTYGRSQIVGLARCLGAALGVWANDPKHQGGAMDAEGARKVRRFLELCDTFHLPVVAFVDEPGFMIGSGAESDGTLREGVEVIRAAMECTVPWLSVVVRKAFGVAAAAHFAPGARVVQWPSADVGPVPLEGGVAVAFRREIAAAEDPDAKRAELEEAFAQRRDPFARAEAFAVHDLIDPRETRPEICRWLELVQPLLERRVRGKEYLP